jgi:hypothetical protein
MIIDDNFLTDDVVDYMEQAFLGDSCPWMLNKHLVSSEHNKFNIINLESYEGVQFNHVLYYAHKDRSELYDAVIKTIYSFCNKHNISVHAMIRAKANLTFPDNKVETEKTKSPHVDHSHNHLVFLYYINDADGDTIVYNEKFDDSNDVFLTEMKRVSPKRGKAICFNGLNYHTPTVPKNGYRAVINVTFAGEFNDN